VHDEKRHCLVGKENGRSYRLAQRVVVRLMEADPMRGSTVFEMVDAHTFDGEQPPRPQRDRGHRRDRAAHKNKRDGEKHRRGGKNKRRGR
jgi:ribonuclease R